MRDELLGHESKDADFLVLGVDIPGLRAALEPHGRTEELIVAERPVGVRFYPRDAELRKLARGGIELAPPTDGLRWGRLVSAACVRRGVLIRPLGDVIVVMPPLTITADEVDRIVDALQAAIAEVTSS